jgi:hypothetical protein
MVKGKRHLINQILTLPKNKYKKYVQVTFILNVKQHYETTKHTMKRVIELNHCIYWDLIRCDTIKNNNLVPTERLELSRP